MDYQENYSKSFSAVKDRRSRIQKANKILRIIQTHIGQIDLSKLTCLDMGCSVGIITNQLSTNMYLTYGIDIDRYGIEQAKNANFNNVQYMVSSVENTPFPDETFDIIVCSQVYEHTPDFEGLVNEIYRLLKSTGICFFSGPNKWALIEEHYNLPFLSWLPRHWADVYVKAVGKSDKYYEMPRSAQELRYAFRRFTIYDYTLQLVRSPERFQMEGQVGVFRYIPKWLLENVFYHWIPNFNWILTK